MRKPTARNPAARQPADEKLDVALLELLTQLDSINYQRYPTTDAQGRITFPALIPGATYRIIDLTAINNDGRRLLRMEFTVKPGETLDLGEIRIEKPQS